MRNLVPVKWDKKLKLFVPSQLYCFQKIPAGTAIKEFNFFANLNNYANADIMPEIACNLPGRQPNMLTSGFSYEAHRASYWIPPGLNKADADLLMGAAVFSVEFNEQKFSKFLSSSMGQGGGLTGQVALSGYATDEIVENWTNGIASREAALPLKPKLDFLANVSFSQKMIWVEDAPAVSVDRLVAIVYSGAFIKPIGGEGGEASGMSQ